MNNTKKNQLRFKDPIKLRLIELIESYPLTKGFMIYCFDLSFYVFYYDKIVPTLNFISDKYDPKYINFVNILLKKLLKLIGKIAKKSYVALPLIVISVGLIQIGSKETNLSHFKLLTYNILTHEPRGYEEESLKQLYIVKPYTRELNWKTFYIDNFNYLIEKHPSKKEYSQIDLLGRRISMTLTPFAQNLKNQICFGLIPLQKGNIKTNQFSFHQVKDKEILSSIPQTQESFFNIIPLKIEWNTIEPKVPIYINQNSLNLFDAIPIKLEGVSKNIKIRKKRKGKKRIRPLFYLKNKDIKQNKKASFQNLESDVFIDEFYEQDEFTEDLEDSIELIKKVTAKPHWNESIFLDKSLLRKIRRLSKRTDQRETLFNCYRDLFFKNDYTNVNPKIFSKKQSQNIKRFVCVLLNPKLEELVKHDESFLEIFDLMEELELSFFNSILRPRYCSGYKFPDNIRGKNKNVIAIEPLKLNIYCPLSRRSFFLDSFLKTSKIRKNRETKNIFYPKPQKQQLTIQKTANYKKRSTIYQKANLFFSRNFWRWNPVFNLNYKPSSKTLVFKHRQFNEFLEVLEPFSWLIILKLGLGIVSFRILQYIYKDHGREIILATINIMHWVGILREVEWLKEDLYLDDYDLKGYRAVRRVRKSSQHAAGITPFFAYFSPALWYLKSKKTIFSRIFNFLNYKLRRDQSFLLQPALLLGPPGTGKTLLIRAFAGETGVPVLLQSGAVLKDFKQRGKGARSVQNLFRRARKVSPCIVFIDEVDGIGARRHGMPSGAADHEDLIDKLNVSEVVPASFDDVKAFHPKSIIKDLLEEQIKLELAEAINFGETLPEARNRNTTRIEVLKELQFEQRSRIEQVGMLTQLLIELDGLNSLDDILILAATNRFYALDPALVRPGRFYKVMTLSLPDYKKRIQILKLYTSFIKIGPRNSTYWHYLAQRMEGLTAADISAIVNESALISISEGTKHNLRSFETSIERILTYNIMRNMEVYNEMLYTSIFQVQNRWIINFLYKQSYENKSQNKMLLKKKKYSSFKHLYSMRKFAFFTNFRRLAYYESGRSIVQTLLPLHPSSVFLEIQERLKNFRFLSMQGIVVNLIDNFKFRYELEQRLIGFLSGKAGEFFSGYASLKPHMQSLVKIVPNKIYKRFNASNIGYDDTHPANLLAFFMIEKWYFYAEQRSANACHSILENFNIPEVYSDDRRFFEAIFEELDSEIDTKNRLIFGRQKQSYKTWWIKELADLESFFDRTFMKWYRIHCSESEESERNIEWVPPDDYYNVLNIRLKDSFILWENFLKLTYEYLYHALLLNCLNFSFSILSNYRELVDYLSDSVIRNKVVRVIELQALMKPFLKSDKISKQSNLDPKILIFLKSWGISSRRQSSLFINLDKLEEDLETQDKLEEDLETQDKLEEDLETQDKLEEDLETQDKLEEDLETQDKLEEDLETQDKLEEDLETQDKLEEDLETQDKLEEDRSN